MRYREFELTEDELFELNMSPGNLQKMAANIDARAGMEFELIVPDVAADEDDYPDPEPDYDMDESFPTGRGWSQEVVNFFMNGDYGSGRREVQGQIDRLEERYWDWKSDQFDDWFSNNSDVFYNTVRDEMSQQDDESDDEFEARVRDVIDNGGDELETAMDRMREEFDSEDQWDEFLSDEDISTMQDFASQYNLSWPYYSEPEYNSGGASIDAVADDFSQAIGRPVNAASSYHGGRREAGHYVVEPDGSLQGDRGETGLEFVSPVLTVPEMLADIDKVAKWASRAGAYTNSSTGLHMNVSVPNQQNLDYVKLAMFLGDNYILEQFGREGNTYCKSALNKIITTARGDPGRVEEMMRQFQGGLSELASKILHTGSTEKFTSINNREGWIEFRGPGGDWLGDDLGPVKNTLLRAVVALDVATKPEEFKQEYYKKLYKTLSRGQEDDSIQYFARYAAGELPQSALKAFVRNIQGKRKANKLALGAKDIMLVWKVIGSQDSPYQSQGIEVAALDELGAFKEAIKQWSLTLGGQSIQDYVQARNWKAQPLRAATSDDMNASSDKMYRVWVEGQSQGVWVRAMSDFQAKRLAMQRHAEMFANAATADIRAAHDPNYTQGETPPTTTYQGRSGDPTPAGAIPGSTVDIQRRRQGAAQMPPIDFDGNYEVYRVESGRTVYRFQADGVPNAYDMLQRWREFMMEPSLNPREFNVRVVAQPQTDSTPARGSDSLPPGNARWRILDRNDQEVYSFVNTTAQSDANQYARNWMINTAPADIRDRGPFNIVPVT